MDGGYALKDPAVGSATSIGRELLSSAEAINKARAAGSAVSYLGWPYSVSQAYSCRLYLRHKFLKQRQRIVLLPDYVKRKPDLHVNNGEQNDASGGVPTYGFG